MSRPNILFIIGDDHRHDAIRAMGDPTVHTPALDRLSASGTVFSRAYIMGGLSGAVCIPSRACVHTGVNIYETSVSREVDDGRGLMTLRPELATLAKTFRDAGYATFGTGKWHNDRRSFAEGFSQGANIFFGGMSDHLEVPLHDFDPSGEYSNDQRFMGNGFSSGLFGRAAIDFLNGYESRDPFFLYLAFTSPHDPRMAPEPYGRMYPPESMPLPDNFMSELPFDNGEMRIRDENLAPFPRTPEIARQHIADYYAMITHQDAYIERVLQALSRSRRADDTIVVYTSDHGLAVGQHGLLGKQNLYDHSVRVPCIVKGPDVPQGKVVDSLVYSYDLFPTLCDLAGVAIPDTVESESLAPLIAGERESARDSVYSVYKNTQRMVRVGDWKLIRYYRVEDKGSNRIQLFNLKDDPWETRDLSDAPSGAARIGRLTEALRAWMNRVDDPLADLPVLP